MSFPVFIAFQRLKIIEMNEKYNKKMQLSPYILAGWLVDGTAGSIRERVILETRDHRIVAVRKAMAQDFTRADLLDLSDCTVLRGLVDCHAHLFMSVSRDLHVREPEYFSGCWGEA